jgi:anti-sigma regulatory factor (Ser/Thr protein kinase)
MEVGPACVGVTDTSHVAEARRAAAACARALGFHESDAGRVALVATEVASNLVKHGGGGTVVVGASPAGAAGPATVELLGIDRGPGMANVDACLVDGYSTAGSPGTGLGAVRRISSEFDVYSRPGAGTVLMARVAQERSPVPGGRTLLVGGVSVPHPAETMCGDDWAARMESAAATIVVSDGLGHGPAAAEAARASTRVLGTHGDRPLPELLELMHDALRPTRGAAVAVARIEREAGRVLYCAVGNISASIVGGGPARHLVSQNGTVGREVRRIQAFTYEWPADGLLILHSDGIGTRWRLDDYPGLVTRHPALIAGVLYRDFGRGRDDATSVVVKGCPGGC